MRGLKPLTTRIVYKKGLDRSPPSFNPHRLCYVQDKNYNLLILILFCDAIAFCGVCITFAKYRCHNHQCYRLSETIKYPCRYFQKINLTKTITFVSKIPENSCTGTYHKLFHEGLSEIIAKKA